MMSPVPVLPAGAPVLTHATRVVDLLGDSDVFLVDGADLESDAMKFAINHPPQRRLRPVLLMLNAAQVERFVPLLVDVSMGVDFVVKPFSQKMLNARVERLMRTVRRTEALRSKVRAADASIDRPSIEARLIHAIANSTFELFYQPKIDITDGPECAGFEALIRWNDRQLGPVPPALFVPIAEELGLITDVTRWVVAAACQQLAEWRKSGLGPLKVSVNVSGHDFRCSDLPCYIERILHRYDLPAGVLELEVTEGILIEDFEASVAWLTQLREIGVSVALDDFGTGYSSLAYLHQIPVDTLKLDRSFIQRILTDWSSAAITSCIITLAQVLGLKVVAEGVATQAQLDVLKDHGCDQVQGELFSMPVSADAAAIWLRGDRADSIDSGRCSRGRAQLTVVAPR